MAKYFCNPLNVPYKYQFNKDPRLKELKICREAADPSLILFKGKYYIFASMSLGYYVSDDLVSWSYKKLPTNLPLYDYAPDVRVIGDYVYFCASNKDHKCDRYRTKNIEEGPYEKIKGTFSFWDPNVFYDKEKDQVYFYYGCSNNEPLYGVELDKNTMKPLTKSIPLIYGDPSTKGYERIGEDNSIYPNDKETIDKKYKEFLKSSKIPSFLIPKRYLPMIKGMFTNLPYIEGAWMDKFNNTYYLQYACPGTQYNTYNDSIYTSNDPLKDFKLSKHNPYSYKPGGFINGAGHGSTLIDKENELWHISTMSISLNHPFERRIGLFKAGIDKDGNLYCNQSFSDYPYSIDDLRKNHFATPKWNLLSYKKKVKASSSLFKDSIKNIVDENIKTIWQPKTTNEDEFIEIDLGKVDEIHAIQVNFGDGIIKIKPTGKIRGTTQARYIEEKELSTNYLLEGSIDGVNYFIINDKRTTKEDLTHDLIVSEEGYGARFIKLSHLKVPYNQLSAISGLRVFGINSGVILPTKPKFKIKRLGDLNIEINIEKQTNITGYNVLFGIEKDKLYHSYMIFDNSVNIGALIKGNKYFVRVDAFNEAGIIEGDLQYEG